ncbi:MAG: CPBP family intramembrane glutamic endopeptidase [Parafilimonas sp.]
MNNQTALSKILSFFLVKIIIGIAVIGVSVFIIESLRKLLLDPTSLTDNTKSIITAIADSLAALFSYIFLFKFYEKRKIQELSLSAFGKSSVIGFITGLALQSVFVLVIYLLGKYSIEQINPASFLLPALAASLTAGFVAEILIVGVFFRLTEEKLGTIITLLICFIFFIVMHVNVKGATPISVLSTAIQAGILLPAIYIFSRNLWLPIFLHFAWDFAEPGIFGGVNPGISIDKSLFTSKISGATFLSGGEMGPQNSIQSLLFCSIVAFIFLRLAKQKKHFIKPFWKK